MIVVQNMGSSLPVKLTTHVLDTAAGVPAAGVAFALYRVSGSFSGERVEIGAGETDADGRSPRPMPFEGELGLGSYALDFDIGTYFAQSQTANSEEGFLGVVSLQFRITKLDRHFHIPLLVSPFGYTTYRGS